MREFPVQSMKKEFGMATITATYLGDLRVESVHAASGARLITDAPVDNNGKGEVFRPRISAPRRWPAAP